LLNNGKLVYVILGWGGISRTVIIGGIGQLCSQRATVRVAKSRVAKCVYLKEINQMTS